MKQNSRLFLSLVAIFTLTGAALLLAGGTLSAASAGIPPAKGEMKVTDPDGSTCISQILSMHAGVQRDLAPTPPGGPRQAGETHLEDLVVVKEVDKCSPKLAEATCKGKTFPKVEIHLTTSTSGDFDKQSYWELVTGNAIIISMQPIMEPVAGGLDAGTPGGTTILLEEIKFDYETVAWKYWPIGPTPERQQPTVRSWSCETGDCMCTTP